MQSNIFISRIKKQKMNKLKTPASRAIYRKAIHQKSQPNYYQKLLTNQDTLTNTHHLQKQLDTHILTLNPQLANDDLEDHDIVISDTDQEIRRDQEMKGYYEKFVRRNQQMKAKQRVEIERMNIQYENYLGIMKNSMDTIDTLVNRLITQIKQLTNKYTEYRHILQSRSLKHQPHLNHQSTTTQSSPQPTTIKQTQATLQQQITKTSNKLIKQLESRNLFIYRLMQEGYYQGNGLVWILEEILRIRGLDQGNGEVLGVVCLGTDVRNVYHLPNTELQFKQQYLPAILDTKSRLYLTHIYTKILHQKHTEQTRSRELRTRISRRQQSQQKQQKSIYIPDISSSITPNSQAKKSQRYNQQQVQGSNIGAYMVAKTHQNMLVMSRLSDLAKSMEVHTRPEKYNYDIKCIYANTRQSLIKWVKGKCKQVVKDKMQQQATQSIIIDQQQQQNLQQSNNRVENDSSIFKRKNDGDSMFVFTNSKNGFKGSSKIGSYVNSPISSNNRKSRKVQQKAAINNYRDLKQKGFSLPMIATRTQKSTPNTRKISIKSKLSDNKSRLDSPDKKRTQKTTPEVCINTQNEQKIRILRIYDRQHQDMALKYLFGTQAKRQVVERLLFQ